jgi:cephalosporin hydroxylase
VSDRVERDLPTFSGKPSAQRAGELRAFLALLVAAGVRSYLEIGARHGDTFAAVANALPASSLLVAVDLPGAEWGRVGSAPMLEDARLAAERKGHRAHVILGDSTAQETIDLVRACSGSYGAVLIDGDHSEAGVRADWENYGVLARLVAFHDVAPSPNNSKVEVPKLWRELAPLYPSVELRDPAAPGMGIGILWRGGV